MEYINGTHQSMQNINLSPDWFHDDYELQVASLFYCCYWMCRMKKIQKIWQSVRQAESRFQMLSFNDVVGGCWSRPTWGPIWNLLKVMFPREFSVENNNWLVPRKKSLSIPMYKNRNWLPYWRGMSLSKVQCNRYIPIPMYKNKNWVPF